MGDLNQIKRDLLDGAVVENVENLKGRVPQSPRRENKSPRRNVQVFATLLVPLVLAGVAFLIWGRGSAPAADPGTVQAPVEPAEDPAFAADQLRFAEPSAIDPNAFPLEIRKIVVDAGHGGSNIGTTGYGLIEKDLTLDIAQRLRDVLVQDDFEVVMTREEDVSVELRDRVDYANESKGDLFVSIHINWISDPRVRGVETFYLGATDDPELSALARKENVESGYSMTDFKTLLEGIYVDLQQHESRSLAGDVHRSIFTSLLSSNPSLTDRGVKTAPFVVLIGNDMPAILAEVACLSNKEDAELLQKPRYRQFIAESLAQGIRSYADSHTDS